jgi:DNA-binding NarL/FixJ family response regulator
MKPIKILIIDDSTAWVKLLTKLLISEEDMLVIGSSTGIEEGYQLINSLNPDVILLDLYFSETCRPEGLDFIGKIRKISDAKIIITTTSDNPDHVIKSFLSGANDFIVKENYKKLPETIREIIKRKSPAEIMKNVLIQYEDVVKEKKISEILKSYSLTEREREVFENCKNFVLERRIIEKLYK